jgi:hypothetical protein
MEERIKKEGNFEYVEEGEGPVSAFVTRTVWRLEQL